MNEFIDIYGNRIKRGDKVVYCLKTSKYTSQFAKAEVRKFTNQKVYIALLEDRGNIEVIYRFLLVTPSKLIKAPIPSKPTKIEQIKDKLNHYMDKIKRVSD